MAEEDGANDAAASQQDNKQQFAIRKIYMRDMSFESPNAPAVFQGEWRPQVSVDLDTRVSRHGEDTYETILRVTVTAKQEDQTAYVAEVEQAGLFVISGFDAKTLDALLGSYCPAQLFPFAREAVAVREHRPVDRRRVGLLALGGFESKVRLRAALTGTERLAGPERGGQIRHAGLGGLPVGVLAGVAVGVCERPHERGVLVCEFLAVGFAPAPVLREPVEPAVVGVEQVGSDGL